MYKIIIYYQLIIVYYIKKQVENVTNTFLHAIIL